MTILGIAAGVAGVLGAVFLHVGAQPQALLFSNLDLKEAGQITQSLDQANIKYEVKGDGSTIMVDRDEVAKARMMLATKGLPTQGSVGYEIFDNAPALGQTEFVQNLNNQRALEGELARTIRSIRGIDSARVLLVMPKRELFEDEAQQPTASVVLGISGNDLNGEQVRAIRNLVASAVPNLRPDKVTVVDDRNHLLAAGDETDAAVGAGAAQHKNEVEDNLRKRVKEIVEGVVGAGAARVTVTADVDQTSTTQEKVQYDPDGQVVRSTQTSESNDKSTAGDTNGVVSAAANIPGGTTANGSGGGTGNQSGTTSETTNYEISTTKTTTVTGPGEVKKLAVSVAVDDSVTPSKDGKAPDTYKKRSPEDMQKIHDLVAAAIGFDQNRGDQLQVVNVTFNHAVGDTAGGVGSKTPLLDFDKNDIMRGAEIGVLLLVALLTLFMVARPLIKFVSGGPTTYLSTANGGALAAAGGAPAGAVGFQGGAPALAGVGGGSSMVPVTEAEQRIDIARIEGQVKASSVKKVSEFVERHPEESVSILRGWLHDS